ncbi:hypothetical protein AVEN_275038-1 [Araneus ventricosus]|uniref:Uncharacterized protein n=1 Tax=Araneus ventricosus TaxID=182803 RepID=A0A4Y2ETT6_ARAVE|nr:hypothetical protein AVEN_275038-1 [Araneus ventricosus]
MYRSAVAVQVCPAGYMTALFKKERAQNERRGETTPNSHMRGMQWLGQVLTMVSRRPDLIVRKPDTSPPGEAAQNSQKSRSPKINPPTRKN